MPNVFLKCRAAPGPVPVRARQHPAGIAGRQRTQTLARPPGIEPISSEPKFMADYLRRLATAGPVFDGLAFERLVVFAARFHRCFFHGF
jgi:hypothetical protein